MSTRFRWISRKRKCRSIGCSPATRLYPALFRLASVYLPDPDALRKFIIESEEEPQLSRMIPRSYDGNNGLPSSQIGTPDEQWVVDLKSLGCTRVFEARNDVHHCQSVVMTVVRPVADFLRTASPKLPDSPIPSSSHLGVAPHSSRTPIKTSGKFSRRSPILLHSSQQSQRTYSRGFPRYSEVPSSFS